MKINRLVEYLLERRFTSRIVSPVGFQQWEKRYTYPLIVEFSETHVCFWIGNIQGYPIKLSELTIIKLDQIISKSCLQMIDMKINECKQKIEELEKIKPLMNQWFLYTKSARNYFFRLPECNPHSL